MKRSKVRRSAPPNPTLANEPTRELVRRLDRLERIGNGSGDEAAAITRELFRRVRQEQK